MNNWGANHTILGLSTAVAGKSSQLNLRGNSNATANVMIGTLSYLDSSGTGAAASLAGIDVYSATATSGRPGSYMVFSTNDGSSTAVPATERMRISSDGYVSIGTPSNLSAFLTIGGSASTMRVLPLTDNVGYVGESTHRWAAIYAANGTIQTSDGREKTDINNSTLGLDFISKLRPVSYKWIVSENIITYEKITNEEGKEEQKEIVTPRPGIRIHYGLIAQEVKEVLGDKDFGGYVHDQETDKMSLRYDQFISPLIKAIQELKATNDDLQTQINELKAI